MFECFRRQIRPEGLLGLILMHFDVGPQKDAGRRRCYGTHLSPSDFHQCRYPTNSRGLHLSSIESADSDREPLSQYELNFRSHAEAWAVKVTRALMRC